MDWNNPNHIAIFAGVGQCLGALVSLLAVIVAIWVAHTSSKDSQKQSRQVRYDTAHPVLVVSGSSTGLHTSPDRNNWIDWAQAEHVIKFQNVGTGTAFNIVSIITGPESLNDNGKRVDASANRQWKSLTSVISVGGTKSFEYSFFESVVPSSKRIISHYSLLAPAQPIRSFDKNGRHIPAYVCRVFTSYHDIFKRKHACIFDLDARGHWVKVDILEEIDMDLNDLESHD